jgi:hypothetical protein
MRLLCRGFFVVLGPYDSLDRVFEYEIRDLVATYESACQRPTVNRNYEDFLYETARSSALSRECKPVRFASSDLGQLTV